MAGMTTAADELPLKQELYLAPEKPKRVLRPEQEEVHWLGPLVRSLSLMFWIALHCGMSDRKMCALIISRS